MKGQAQLGPPTGSSHPGLARDLSSAQGASSLVPGVERKGEKAVIIQNRGQTPNSLFSGRFRKNLL